MAHLVPTTQEVPRAFCHDHSEGEVSVEYVGLVSLVSLKNEHEP